MYLIIIRIWRFPGYIIQGHNDYLFSKNKFIDHLRLQDDEV